jgi:hypothetical protein
MVNLLLILMGVGKSAGRMQRKLLQCLPADRFHSPHLFFNVSGRKILYCTTVSHQKPPMSEYDPLLSRGRGATATLGIVQATGDTAPGAARDAQGQKRRSTRAAGHACHLPSPAFSEGQQHAVWGCAYDLKMRTNS